MLNISIVKQPPKEDFIFINCCAIPFNEESVLLLEQPEYATGRTFKATGWMMLNMDYFGSNINQKMLQECAEVNYSVAFNTLYNKNECKTLENSLFLHQPGYENDSNN